MRSGFAYEVPVPGQVKTSESGVWDEWIRRPPEEAVPEGLSGRWWVAHTRPRNEKSLATDLSALRIFSYLPLRARVTHSANTGRASRSIVPVFTGYVFFNGDDEQRRLALTTNRVAATLVVPNQNQLIDQLRHVQRVIASRAEFEWGPTLAEGDRARVTGGPLMGLEGVVIRRARRTRLALNVQMLSQSVVVEVERDLLEKLENPAPPADSESTG